VSEQLGNVRAVRVSPIERIARWWTSASNEERFRLLQAACQGEKDAPPLRTLQLAIYLAEVEAGEVAQG
jgi:hypothetical protein